MTKLRSIKGIKLEIILDKIDWELLATLIPRKRSKVGRKIEYSENKMLRLVILQDIEMIEYDTDMERKLKSSSEYRNFCDLEKVPSHDTISRFKRKLRPKVWKKIHEKLDQILEESGVFDNDELCGDGTDIPLPTHVNVGTWGAKSNKDKFFGLWLMTMNSTNTELVRDFNIGSAKIGQISLMNDIIHDTSIHRMDKTGKRVYLDGIFDTRDIRKTIADGWKKIPMIPYNPRNSPIKKAKNLSPNDWRLAYTPGIRDEEKFNEKYKKRTGAERENGRLKQWTLMGRLYEKARRAFRITGRYIVNQMIISMISTQVRALAHQFQKLMQPVVVQTSLNKF